MSLEGGFGETRLVEWKDNVRAWLNRKKKKKRKVGGVFQISQLRRIWDR